ncbi:MAG: hypothetical protein HC880_07450, partial [Bacteroidia bacterium]|nr:hypothetical protein [Bacteroidia bacterium]
MDYIDRKFQDYLHRGQGYIRYKNWDRAINELQQAVNLKPLHLEALTELADTYRQRWHQVKAKYDHDKLFNNMKGLDYVYMDGFDVPQSDGDWKRI